MARKPRVLALHPKSNSSFCTRTVFPSRPPGKAAPSSLDALGSCWRRAPRARSSHGPPTSQQELDEEDLLSVLLSRSTFSLRRLTTSWCSCFTPETHKEVRIFPFGGQTDGKSRMESGRGRCPSFHPQGRPRRPDGTGSSEPEKLLLPVCFHNKSLHIDASKPKTFTFPPNSAPNLRF